jgi:hypothetical protein
VISGGLVIFAVVIGIIVALTLYREVQIDVCWDNASNGLPVYPGATFIERSNVTLYDPLHKKLAIFQYEVDVDSVEVRTWYNRTVGPTRRQRFIDWNGDWIVRGNRTDAQISLTVTCP